MAAPSIFRRYWATWLGAMSLMALAVAMLAWLADPYRVLGTPDIAGLNRSKPATVERAALAKAYLLRRSAPGTLLLGTSKVECGLDPRSPWLRQGPSPVFNAGVPGTDVRYSYGVLRDAIRVAPVRRVLLLVEPTELLSAPAADEASPPGPFLPEHGQRARDLVLALLSRDALFDSVETLASQRGRASGLDQTGLLADDFFTRSTDREGFAALFRQKLPTEVATLDRIGRQTRQSPAARIAGIYWTRRIIALARDHDIVIDIAIAPVHADLLRLIDRARLWPRLAQGKRALAEAVEREGKGRVALWDFARFDRYSTEPLPAGSATPMQWFWEPNHFRRSLGERILQVVYGHGSGYGELLKVADVDRSLARDDGARRRDRIVNSAENQRLSAQLSSAGVMLEGQVSGVKFIPVR